MCVGIVVMDDSIEHAIVLLDDHDDDADACMNKWMDSNGLAWWCFRMLMLVN